MTAMKFVPLVQRLLDNWLLVGEFFASRNWPDTKLGNAARELNADIPRIAAALSAVEPAPDGLVERWDASSVSHKNKSGIWSAGINDSRKWGHRIQVHADTIEEAEALRDQVLAALTSRAAVEGQPVAWVRFCSDGTYEGPLMDCAIEDVRKKSGAWTPLYKPASRAAVLEEAAKNDARYRALRLQNSIRMPRVMPPFLEAPNDDIGYKSPEAIDRAIDAAIRAAKGE